MGRRNRLPEKQSKLVEGFTPKNSKQQEFINLIKENEWKHQADSRLFPGLSENPRFFCQNTFGLNLLIII